MYFPGVSAFALRRACGAVRWLSSTGPGRRPLKVDEMAMDTWRPVRANASEAFLLRNTGLADGRFVLSVPPPFSVTPSDGSLRAGEAMQLTFGFAPQQHGDFAEELLIEYDLNSTLNSTQFSTLNSTQLNFAEELLIEYEGTPSDPT